MTLRGRIVSAWEWASGLGADDTLPAPDRRRVRLCNQSGLIGTLTVTAFSLVYLVTDPRTFRLALLHNLVGAVTMFAAIPLNAAGRRRLARVVCLTAVNAQVLIASFLFGSQVGLHYYFFVFAPVAFLLFSDEEEWVARFGFAAGSAAAFVYIHHVGPVTSLIHLSPAKAQAFNVASALFTLGTITFVVHLFRADTARAEAQLADEHARSERLLLNILPLSISRRLKEDNESIADGFSEVTVLFADLVGFTRLSAGLSPESLVRLLNRIFSEFDALTVQHGLEKIKTIGDAYMVASGLPEARPDHAHVIARMALDMRTALERVNIEAGHALSLRIGIHTGPVVAGVIGTRKFIYDLWGDTVNVASRMESHGLPGQIQVTEEVRLRIEGDFEMSARGDIEIKGKGAMRTYLLEGIKR